MFNIIITMFLFTIGDTQAIVPTETRVPANKVETRNKKGNVPYYAKYF